MIRTRTNKYNAIRTKIDGINFPSKAESDCYLMLKKAQQFGEIRDLQCHVKTPLIAGISHQTDFKFFDIRLNETVWAEYKGKEDQRWRDIKKLWIHSGPGILRVYKGFGLKMHLSEEILPLGDQEKVK